jgi:hypothetical protein
MKIEKLTAEQEAMIPIVRDEFIGYGISTEPANWAEAERAINDAYTTAGLSAPKMFFHTSSPYEGNVYCNVLTDEKFIKSIGVVDYSVFREKVAAQADKIRGTKLNTIWPSMYGHHDAGWVSFYSFFDKVCGLSDAARLEPFSRIVMNCGWVWFYKDIVVTCDRPEVLKRDNENRLHCEDGPSVRYRDGFSVYCWHGTRIPSEWIENRQTLTPELAITWQNIEQRRCAMEILGWAHILDKLNAKVIDTDADPEIGELVEVDIPDVGREKFLRVKCGTGRMFALPVPPDMKTALEAQSWTWDIPADVFVKPEVRT